MYARTVVGTDGSETADRAVDAALTLASVGGGTVHVVTAYRPLDEHEIYERQRGLTPDQRRDIDSADDARHLLERMAKRAADAGVTAELHARVGDPAAAILNLAAEVDADLIVLGNRGMTGMRRLLGSVPNDVAHRARCSVLIVDTGAG